jgi:hypothetical protein
VVDLGPELAGQWVLVQPDGKTVDLAALNGLGRVVDAALEQGVPAVLTCEAAGPAVAAHGVGQAHAQASPKDKKRDKKADKQKDKSKDKSSRAAPPEPDRPDACCATPHGVPAAPVSPLSPVAPAEPATPAPHALVAPRAAPAGPHLVPPAGPSRIAPRGATSWTPVPTAPPRSEAWVHTPHPPVEPLESPAQGAWRGDSTLDELRELMLEMRSDMRELRGSLEDLRRELRSLSGEPGRGSSGLPR